MTLGGQHFEGDATPATLAQALTPHIVDAEQLYRENKSVINVVEVLIGVVPNCNPYLEIWPTAFRTFNLLIPNLLNLPPALMGQGAPKDLVGLAMFISSREAGCAYCTAHHCSFAIRRGASMETVVDGDFSPHEAAVAELARSMATVPTEMTNQRIAEVEEFLEAGDIEWLVLAVATSGFLNKIMDTMGMELEFDTIRDVAPLIGDKGWDPGKHQWVDELPSSDGDDQIPVDDIKTILKVLRQAPGAIRYDASATKGVSGRIGSALMMLEDEIGYAFPILASIQHKKAVRAIATALRDNLDPDNTEVGLSAKCLVALVYARVVSDEALLAEAVLLADLLAPNLSPDVLVDVVRFADAAPEDTIVPDGLSPVDAAAIILAKAAAPSPSTVNEITISNVIGTLRPAQVVETVLWLALLQLLHRLYAFYDARIGLT